MTACAKRYQSAGPGGAGCAAAQAHRHAARGGRTAPGSTSSATTPASSATATPPIAIERRNASGKTSSDAKAAATVTALNATVLPAVATVVRSAACGSDRELLAVAREQQQAVVDREPEPCAGDEVESEDGDGDRRVREPQHGERRDDREHAGGDRQERRDDAAEDPDAEQRAGAGTRSAPPEEVALGLPPDLLARDGGAADKPRRGALDPARGPAGVAAVPQVGGDHDRTGPCRLPRAPVRWPGRGGGAWPRPCVGGRLDDTIDGPGRTPVRSESSWNVR